MLTVSYYLIIYSLQNLMHNFTAKIVGMMKSEGLYASQGGPIILSQVQMPVWATRLLAFFAMKPASTFLDPFV